MDHREDEQFPIHNDPFDWVKVGVRRPASRELFHPEFNPPEGFVDVRVSSVPSSVIEQMIVTLQAKVLKYDLPGHEIKDKHTVTFDVPDSPWQHWKRKHEQSWWMRWFVQRWPVQTEQLSRTVHFTATWEDMATYPWQTVAPTARELGRAVRLVDLKLRRDER